MLRGRANFLLRSLYRKYYSNKKRAEMLKHLPKNSVGAEFGVFTGEFSRVLLQSVSPKELHLIDPWWKEYGENFPSWVKDRRLTTRRAHQLTEKRVDPFRNKTNVKIIVEHALEYANKMPEKYFDWVYLDTTHSYEDTIEELNVLKYKVKDDGYIAGDDWQADKNHRHHGVYVAVQEFTRQEPFEIIYADNYRQWCLRKI